MCVGVVRIVAALGRSTHEGVWHIVLPCAVQGVGGRGVGTLATPHSMKRNFMGGAQHRLACLVMVCIALVSTAPSSTQSAVTALSAVPADARREHAPKVSPLTRRHTIGRVVQAVIGRQCGLWAAQVGRWHLFLVVVLPARVRWQAQPLHSAHRDRAADHSCEASRSQTWRA